MLASLEEGGLGYSMEGDTTGSGTETLRDTIVFEWSSKSAT